MVLYAIVTRGNFSSPVFVYMYLGNAFYTYVGAVMTGMAFAVVDDRERYQTLRSIYVAPVDIRWYLAGRGVARFILGSVSVAITIALGVFFLHVPIHFGRPLGAVPGHLGNWRSDARDDGTHVIRGRSAVAGKIVVNG